MKKLTLLIVFFIGITTFSCANKTNEGITVVSPEEMETLLNLEDVQLVDVRTNEEHSKGHLANSQNIDFNSPTFDEDIVKLDKEKPVLLYCQRGGRSAKCAEKMQEAGFKKIYDLKGGFSKWEHIKLDIFKLKS